ncbi:hypothetical protein ACLB2K_057868 [Fragaria x ananassa]
MQFIDMDSWLSSTPELKKQTCLHAHGKLVIYPKGNKKKKAEDHISVYLQIAGAKSLETGWEVYVDFRFFLLYQNKNVYMVFEDAFTKRNCIHGAKLDVGFDKLVPLDEFHDASHGYLVDDKCVFGAEVFVCKETRRGMGECVSRVKNPITYKHIWKVRNFSSLADPYYTSEPFTAGGQIWIIKLYPKGVDQQNRRISVLLHLVGRKATPLATKVFVEFSMRIVNPLINSIYWSRTDPVKRCFTIGGLGYGCRGFVTLDNLTRIVFFDTCTIETVLTVHGITEGPCDSEEENSSIKAKRLSRILKAPCVVSVSCRWLSWSCYSARTKPHGDIGLCLQQLRKTCTPPK